MAVTDTYPHASRTILTELVRRMDNYREMAMKWFDEKCDATELSAVMIVDCLVVSPSEIC